MDRRQLFLSTLDDLESRVSAPDPYSILRSSLLIRQLFLDEGTPLVDQVNRDVRLKFSFKIVEFADIGGALGLGLTLNMNPDGLDPDVHDSLPETAPARKTVGRDQFFGATVGIVFGQRLTTLDVVKHVAYTMGGVHAGTPKSEADEALAKLGAQLRIGGVAPAIRIIRAAGKGCLRALQPLREAVAASLAAERPNVPSVPAVIRNPPEAVAEVKPNPVFDWSSGLQLFCVFEARGAPTTTTVLCSYGRDEGRAYR